MAAKPLEKYTSKTLSPNTIKNECPKCGKDKRSTAHLCLSCWKKTLHPPIINQTFIIDGVRCRKVPLTKGKYATVNESDYARVMELDWHIFPNFDRGLYAVGYNKATGKHIRMHRFIMNARKGQQWDHVDGDGLNNTRKNLRSCSTKQNAWNRKLNRNNTSGYRGVHWHSKHKVWVATIRVHGREVTVGTFHDPIEAAVAWDEAAKATRQKEFARLNFPD